MFEDTSRDATQKLVFPDDHDCPVRNVLPGVASKWSILVLLALTDGPERFKCLHERVENISERMLTVTLQRLVRDGFVVRERFSEKPPRVEYQLTRLGREYTQPLAELILWAKRKKSEIDQARESYDQSVLTTE